MGVPVSSALTVSLLNNPFLNSLTAEDLKSLQSYEALNCHNEYFLWKSDLTLLKTPFKLIRFKKHLSYKYILRIFVAYWLKSCFNSANIYINSAKRLFICNIKTIYQCLSLSHYFYREVVSVWK